MTCLVVRPGCSERSSAWTRRSKEQPGCTAVRDLMLGGAGLGDTNPMVPSTARSVGNSVLGMLPQDGERLPFAVPSAACATAHSVARFTGSAAPYFTPCAAGLVIPTAGCWVVSTQIPLRRQAHDMYERTHQKDSNISFEAHRGRALHVARGRGGNGAGRSAGRGSRGLESHHSQFGRRTHYLL